MGHQSVRQNFGAGDVKCFVLPSFLLCFPLLYQQSLPHIFHRSNVGSLFDCSPLRPLPNFFFFCSICCIVQNGFLLQETSSRKSQSAPLPSREMFSAIQNNSSTPPRNSTLANFTGLFNRRCLVNSLETRANISSV